jgi:hypothetical protein
MGIDFNMYVMLTCQYAFREYDLGIKTSAALFHLTQEAIDYLGTCWMTCAPVPNAANFIAQKIKEGNGNESTDNHFEDHLR